MTALFLNTILNTFLSGRVISISGKFEFRSFEAWPKQALLIKNVNLRKEELAGKKACGHLRIEYNGSSSM